MYPITSFKCKMYKEIVKVMISLMITLYQVKHVSSELAKDVCLSFSVGIFGFVSSAHTAANNWRAHSHRCCFKLQNLKRHYFSFNWWHIVEFRWYQFTGSSSEKRSGSWDHFPQFLWFASQSHSSVFRHFRSNIFDGCPWPTLCCFEHRHTYIDHLLIIIIKYKTC